VYGHDHYHINAFIAIFITRGCGEMRVGGPFRGAIVAVAQGDCLLVPPGISIRQTSTSSDFAHITSHHCDPGHSNDEVLRTVHNQAPSALDRLCMEKVEPPLLDPFLGASGPYALWDLFFA
jgi:Uncharacterized protein containing double-stranded beta helix domain